MDGRFAFEITDALVALDIDLALDPLKAQAIARLIENDGAEGSVDMFQDAPLHRVRAQVSIRKATLRAIVEELAR